MEYVQSFTKCVVSSIRPLIADECGNAVSEYALVASSFAMLMLGMMMLVQGAAAGQLTYTQNGLNNRNGITP
jgi:Flp pilus assembly pilin Flp